MVIDSVVGFVGGLDLCYGRYDDASYRLIDSDQVGCTLFPGADYNNVKLKDFDLGRNFDKTLIHRNVQPRMPWRDMHVRVEGNTVNDMRRSFVQYWSYFQRCHNVNMQELTLSKKPEKALRTNLRQKLRPIKDMTHRGPNSYLDLNAILAKDKLAEVIAVTRGSVDGTDMKLDDVEEVAREMFLQMEKEKGVTVAQDFKFERTSTAVLQLTKELNRETMKEQITRQTMYQEDRSFSHITQIVRSTGTWSLGLRGDNIENSIYLAYLELIKAAKKFIYIENQFFLSDTAGEPLRNKVAQALVLRVQQAIEQKEDFLVLIVIPLMPGFEGAVDQKEGAFTRITLGYQQQTISKGATSVYGQLKLLTNDPTKYVKFVGLRQHAENINDHPVSEQVYVHSKMMIVDDNIMLIGSANINDRSLLGSRDTEMAIVIEDEVKVNSLMGDLPFECSELVHSTRIKCFEMLFGLSEAEVADPMSPPMWRDIDRQLEVADCSC